MNVTRIIVIIIFLEIFFLLLPSILPYNKRSNLHYSSCCFILHLWVSTDRRCRFPLYLWHRRITSTISSCCSSYQSQWKQLGAAFLSSVCHWQVSYGAYYYFPVLSSSERNRALEIALLFMCALCIEVLFSCVNIIPFSHRPSDRRKCFFELC